MGSYSALVVAWFRQKLFKLFNYAANRKLCGNFVATVGPADRMEHRWQRQRHEQQQHATTAAATEACSS